MDIATRAERELQEQTGAPPSSSRSWMDGGSSDRQVDPNAVPAYTDIQVCGTLSLHGCAHQLFHGECMLRCNVGPWRDGRYGKGRLRDCGIAALRA